MKVYTPVVVTDESLERAGQVGVIVALANEDGEYSVKFDDGDVELYTIQQIKPL